MKELKQILANIENSRDLAVELQRGLTAIPALDPSSGGDGEWDKAEWLEAELRRLPFDEIRRYDCPQPEAKRGLRPNLVCRYRGRDSSRTLWIMTHLDVVPPGDLAMWRTDPYVLHVADGKLYGRGTEDNQQGLVASILCVKAMMDAGIRPPVDVGLLFNADEETGSTYGAHHVASRHPEVFGPRDAFLVPDAGDEVGSMIEVAEKSLLWLKVTTHGRQCHGSVPDQGANAFKAASELVFKLGSLYRTFNQRDRLYDPPRSTFEPTKKEANVPNVNTIPGEDVFYLDMRVMPAYPLAAVKDEIRRLADQVAARHGVTFSFDVQQEAQAAPPTSPEADIVKLVARGARMIHGVKARPKGIGGGTVAAVFRQLGYPAVVYAKQDEVAHQPNEYCILDNLIGDAQVFAFVALNLTA
jgi:succinyl-diaminopimelate desuccinylase